MTEQKGPFPLTLTKHGDRYVITTAQGNHWLTTYDPHAATLSLAAPDLLEAAQKLAQLLAPAWGRASTYQDRLDTAIQQLNEAISKAKGES